MLKESDKKVDEPNRDLWKEVLFYYFYRKIVIFQKEKVLFMLEVVK